MCLHINICCWVAKLCPTLVTLWTVAHQAPLFMEFPRQDYWSEWPFPSPGDPPKLEIEPMSPILASRFSTTDPQGKSITYIHTYNEILLTHKKEWNNAICSNAEWLSRASLIAQLVKNLPAMEETPVQFLGWEDPLEKGKVTYSSILWRTPRTVQSMGSQRLGHNWATSTSLSMNMINVGELLLFHYEQTNANLETLVHVAFFLK